ncbi:MAG: hypothetical protein PX481_17260 [Microcystis sp. M53603_WE2]|uniref:hypothetical protein n=1 Tax=unclassified Microcystis TaxID=2643300 RepID=UPI0022C553E4|nr:MULTISPECIES: hypothetical protein [unclassified Microcystis]MCE2662251.1 hypothetical protein [Microcystis sp. 53602_E8]MDJ0524872.1 hypothetical protein [Microcystis sp. M53600_WE12]MDJ0545166.1 hypothetical protein [Microcystis sp. M53601_WE4]MDJ0564136.1 hypothetical protein [Microcystis sp. M49629_WE12]MCZ8049551.1 hypothetical protein [Microcystis sp. LE19-41.2A]
MTLTVRRQETGDRRQSAAFFSPTPHLPTPYTLHPTPHTLHPTSPTPNLLFYFFPCL